ncbi:GIN domain-containing protein [Mucilaginibacter gilvus]|uniref:Putative auto-transporter adhesin head GIN domain-containing protein n=1 Tax=Mucilaginibacter gilvus TaxID=2305909 RepID=A0A3S3VVK6_9SPHI|nr:DUF2807 domain-containing protein [Mucilaginibacter gilvus]RWY57015.1 hypothetical protein EPL05_00340 [Mucilaginibacter gilvus]
MKTSIFTILAIVALAVGSTNSSFASVKNDNKEVSTILTNISQISKIEVHGNVELYISDGNTDQVKVYNQYYAESALVQSQNGVLRISSYKAEKLVVWVTANDLRAISVYDNAAVKSFGSLSKIDLDVNLYDNATATLNIEAYRTTLTVNDNAKATLTGSVTEYSLKYADSAKVINDNFITVNESKMQVPAAGKRDIAGL